MAFSWNEPMNKKEEAEMVKFIMYTYEGYNKCDYNDRNVDHILHFMVREITRLIGQLKNLKMSLEAKKILGECKCLKDIENKKKINSKKIIFDHNPPAKKFFEELKNKKFTNLDAERWLREASIVAITKDEDLKLTNNGFMEDRPIDAYDRLGIKTIEVWPKNIKK